MQEGLSVGFQCVSDCGPSMITRMLWLIPAVPIVASGVIALLKQPKRRTAATLAIGSLGFSLLLSLAAFAHVLSAWVGDFNSSPRAYDGSGRDEQDEGVRS